MKKLTVDDIEVPEGMVEAFCDAMLAPLNRKSDENMRNAWRKEVATVLLYLAENPVVPSGEELDKIWHGMPLSVSSYPYFEKMCLVFAKAQSAVFLRKPDALPDEVKKLLYLEKESNGNICYPTAPCTVVNKLITAAYKLGKEGK